MQTHTCEKKWAIDHTHTLIFKTHTFFQVCKGSTTQYHVLEKPKEVGQASLDWNTHSSPCSLNNLKQVARHIWVSRKIRVIVKLDTDYNWVRIFFFTIKASFGPEALSSPCMSCVLSLSLVLSVSSLPMIPEHRTFCQYRGSASWHLQFSYRSSWAQICLVIFQTAVPWAK